MSTTRIQIGGMDATLSDGLEDALRRIVERATGTAGRVLGAKLDDIEAAAAQAMPVRSGKLRASLQRYTNIGHDEVRSGLRMGSTAAPYAYKVKFAKGTPLAGRSVFQELLRKPAVAAIDEVVGELADQVISRPTRGS